jgi:RNA polymerase sigma factor (sigma-70 family)
MSAVAAAPASADVGSPESYAADLYERHHQTIFRLCLRQLRRREDADDAVQTTFVYALMSLRRGVVPRLELPWLLTIAKNVCSTRRRSGMRRGTYDAPQDLDLIQDRLATPDRSDVASPSDLRSALQAIPETQRKALLLREWRGLSYDEIGSELGLSHSATEALLFRARQNVAQRLGAALKALNGLPALNFIRSLFETGTAKLIAAAVGTTLTIAAVPAAQHRQNDLGAPPPRLVPSPAVAHTAPTVGQRNAAPGHLPRASRPAGVTHVRSLPVPASRTPQSPTTARPDVSAAAKLPPPPPVHTDASTTAPAPATTSVDITTPDVGVDVSLPAVTTPTVTTPDLGLPVSVPPVTVDVPPLPNVQLP